MEYISRNFVRIIPVRLRTHRTVLKKYYNRKIIFFCLLGKMGDLYEQVISSRFLHVYGHSIEGSWISLSKRIVETYQERKVVVCFRTKNDVWEALRSVSESDLSIYVDGTQGGNIDFKEGTVILCTTGFLKTLLLAGAGVIMDHIITFASEVFDINLLYNLAYIKANIDTFSPHLTVTIITPSKWTKLPVLGQNEYELQNNEIEIIYEDPGTPRVEERIKDRKERILYYGYEAFMKDNPKIIRTFRIIHCSTCKIVIDSFYNKDRKEITKELADSRTNSIDKGICYRRISEKDYKRLENNAPFDAYIGVSDLVLFLLSEGDSKILDVMNEDVFPEYTFPGLRTEIEKELKQVEGISTGVAKAYISQGLNLYAGMLKKQIDGANEDSYIGIVTAHLLNKSPDTYADVSSYQSFAGRNDIETMWNFWQSLTCSIRECFINWGKPQGKKKVKSWESIVETWCNKNSFFVAPVIKLFGKIKQQIERAGTGTENRIGVQDILPHISTKEINMLAVSVSKVYPREKAGNTWYCLPRISTNDVVECYRIHKRGSNLLMFIDVAKLELTDPRFHRDNLSDL